MTRRRFARIACALLACAPLVGSSAAPAHAGTRVTPPVHNDVDRVGCVVQNRDTKTREVTATLRAFTGAALSSLTTPIPAGAAVELVFTAVFQPYVYCEFVGTTKKVRGYLDVQSAGGGTTTLLLPAE
jgi:hypothetical protein